MVSALEESPWVSDLEALEPGCILDPMQPELMVDGVRGHSPPADRLIAELEALPLAEHHADRAPTCPSSDGMLRFRLIQPPQTGTDRAAELALTEVAFPVEWAVLPMVPTGRTPSPCPGPASWAWAMDLPTALSSDWTSVEDGMNAMCPNEWHRPPVCGRHCASPEPKTPFLPCVRVSLVRGRECRKRRRGGRLDADLLRPAASASRHDPWTGNFRRDRPFTRCGALRERDRVPFPVRG